MKDRISANSWKATLGAFTGLLLFAAGLLNTELLAQSDTGFARAEGIAHKVMEASGGEERWENTRYLHWDFFGIRELWWDKQEHRVRIEWPEKELIIIADLKDGKGKAWQGDEAVQDSTRKVRLMSMAEKIWANDSYWLFMPFKMLDPGVRLKYLGEDSLSTGPAHRLKMTFEEVGFTPQNKYHVWVDQKDHLVRKWAYFKKRDKKKPDMTTPWKDYTSYNGLRLSSDRGDRTIRDISVPDRFPEGTFSDRKLTP